MGLLYRATENSRQSGRGAEARRNFSVNEAFALAEQRTGAPCSAQVPSLCSVSSLCSKHARYCRFNFVTRDACHVASARWLLRMRAPELQREVAWRLIQWTVIRGRAQIVEQTNNRTIDGEAEMHDSCVRGEQ